MCFLNRSEFCHNLIGTIIGDLVCPALLGIVLQKTKRNTLRIKCAPLPKFGEISCKPLINSENGLPLEIVKLEYTILLLTLGCFCVFESSLQRS